MKKNLFLAALIVALCTSPSFAQHNLLNRMLGRAGCGCCEPVKTCCEAPAPTNTTCCDNFRFERGGNCGCRGLFPLFGQRGGGCNDCCVAAPAPAPAAAPAPANCGCAADPCDPCSRGGFLSRLGSRGCGNNNDCGCQPAADPCDPCSRGGFLSRLGSRGCGNNNDCGCQPAANACDPCSRGSLFSGHLFHRHNDCGCSDPCDNGCGRGRLFAGHNRGGDCGCSDPCDNGCGPRFGTREVCFRVPSLGLLERARACRPQRNACCDTCGTNSGNCGCTGGTPAPAAAPAADPQPQPAAPAPATEAPAPATPDAQAVPQTNSTRIVPMVDPNAFRTPTTRFTSGEID